MFEARIKCSHGEWFDHIGNPIKELVFNQKYYAQYEPGCYPVASFGSLYRNIDNFRKTPVQALTEWELTIPSVYSSKDGSFQTVDIFYFLEYINEANGKYFNLIGCEAVLFKDGSEYFKGVVDSIENSGRTTSIRISESIGDPIIEKSDFPIAIGNSELLKWPVKLTKNEVGQNVIVISEKPLQKFYGFFIYLEKLDTFVPARYSIGNQRVEFSSFFKTAVFSIPNNIVYRLSNPINAGERFAVDPSDRFLRTDSTETPDDYIVGSGDNAEFVQAWSSRFGPDLKYNLGRDIPSRQKDHPAGTAFKKASVVLKNEFEISLVDYPISLAQSSSNHNYGSARYILGNPSYFLEASRKKMDSDIFATEKLLNLNFPAFGGLSIERLDLAIAFPDIDLPSSAYVSNLRFSIRVKSHLSVKFPGIMLNLRVGDKTHRPNISFSGDLETFNFPTAGLLSFSQTRKIKIEIVIPTYGIEYYLTLIGLSMSLKVRMPFDEGKLYASGRFSNSGIDNPFSGSSIIPSIYGLLDLANISDYSVQPANDGELSDIAYGTIIKNEAVKFREKLRSLAAESAVLIKSNPVDKNFLVKSISRHFKLPVSKLIPLRAILLENNIYNFTMQSPDRNDILNGISIFWDKDFETDKYKHSFSVEAGIIRKDGNIVGNKDDCKLDIAEHWAPIFKQLSINARDNIGASQSINSEFISNWDGAEIMAYNYLCWNAAPLRKAQINCITSIFRQLSVDIGDFVYFNFPGYPPKLPKTSWVITGLQDDLNNMATGVELLEAWNIPVIPAERYLLLEDGGNILTEEEGKFKLETQHGQS